MSQKIIGADIGGTTFSSTLFDGNMSPTKKSKKENISSIDSTSNLLEAISQQINNLVETDIDSVAGIGISCPGPLDSNKGIILNTPNLKFLQNIHLKEEIQNRCGLPVYIENDANLFTLGEWHIDGCKDGIFGGITLGTGMGFGLVINRSLYRGAHGLAMEYAISPVDNGNWESSVSINAIKRISDDVMGEKLEPLQIYELATQGDSKALIIWKVFGNNLGRALSHFINMLDPHRISIGGGVSGAFNYFEGGMVAALEKFSPSFIKNKTIIFESKYKELSSMIGAAILVKQSLESEHENK